MALVMLGVGLGGALAWHGINALRGQSSLSFWPPSGWLILLPYLPALLIGQLLISFDLWPALTFPLFHLLAAAIPPLAILAFAGRSLPRAEVGWRDIVVQLSTGAFLATTLAFIIEILLGLIILAVTVMATALTPGGRATLETLLANLQDPLWLENPENVMQLITFPPVFMTLALVFIVAGPIVEELVKPLGVVLMSYRRPSAAQAFLWGLASGAGFAMAENAFNTTLALEVWALVIPLRIGATAMHCLCTALTSLGWQRFLVERRPWSLVSRYGQAVAIHATWNATVIGLASLSLFAMDDPSQTVLALAGLVALFCLTLILALTLGAITGLILLTRRLQTMNNEPSL
jgi:RsiW-degrading membrane proteinase PrsW (M82 family)